MSAPGNIVVTPSDVEHVALLARLELSQAEVANFCSQLNDILLYVQQLQQVSTDHVAPTSHPLALSNITRPDELWPSLSADEVLAIAPARHHQFVKVPKIIE